MAVQPGGVRARAQVNVEDELARREAAAVMREDALPYATQITKGQRLAAQQSAARASRSTLGGTKAFEGSASAGHLAASSAGSRAGVLATTQAGLRS